MREKVYWLGYEHMPAEAERLVEDRDFGAFSAKAGYWLIYTLGTDDIDGILPDFQFRLYFKTTDPDQLKALREAVQRAGREAAL